MPQNEKSRDIKFDGLRVIGLLAIILAHVDPPALLFQLRNFDVPLMVLVSGAVYGLSSTQKKYFSYIWGRVNRLLVPTWVFLCLFFLIQSGLGRTFSIHEVLSSFALINGIGYVWIIRVFILVALIAPFFVLLYKKMQNKNIYLLSVLAIFIFYNLLHRLYTIIPFLHTNAAIDFIFQNIIFYLLPFGCIAGLGLYLLHASKKSLVTLLLIFSSVFGILAYKYGVHGFIPTQAYKYPPGIYYIAYALAASLGLYLISFTKFFQAIFSIPLMRFIAASSLWIYLWQILFLFQWGSWDKYIPPQLSNFLCEYLLILFFSILVTYLQKFIIRVVVLRMQNGFVKTALTVSFLK